MKFYTLVLSVLLPLFAIAQPEIETVAIKNGNVVVVSPMPHYIFTQVGNALGGPKNSQEFHRSLAKDFTFNVYNSTLSYANSFLYGSENSLISGNPAEVYKNLNYEFIPVPVEVATENTKTTPLLSIPKKNQPSAQGGMVQGQINTPHLKENKYTNVKAKPAAIAELKRDFPKLDYVFFINQIDVLYNAANSQINYATDNYTFSVTLHYSIYDSKGNQTYGNKAVTAVPAEEFQSIRASKAIEQLVNEATQHLPFHPIHTQSSINISADSLNQDY